MATSADLLHCYYQAMKDGGFDEDWFSEDFKFSGPFKTSNNRTEFFELTKRWSESVEVKDFNFIERFFSDDDNHACIFYECETKIPVSGKTKAAEFFTFENGKIKEIQLVYDGREWAKYFDADAT